LTQRVLCESAAGRTDSCSAGYAALIAFVQGASTSRKQEGILTDWLPIKTPSALTDRRRMLRYRGWRGTGGEHSIAATEVTVGGAKARTPDAGLAREVCSSWPCFKSFRIAVFVSAAFSGGVLVVTFASSQRKTPCFRGSPVADSHPDCYASASLRIWTFAHCR
jgi:hypothetical protein